MLSLGFAAAKAWFSDGCSSLSAALAFWIALTLTPILLVVTRIAAMFCDAEAVRMALVAHAGTLMGADAADLIGAWSTQMAIAGSGADALLSIGVALFSATATLAGFGEPIQRIWRHSDADHPLRQQFALRLAALAWLLIAGVALAALFVAEMLVAALAASLAKVAIGGMFYWGGHRLLTMLLLTLLYLLAIKLFAPASLRWRAAWIGAFTASLLTVGSHYLLGRYLSYAPLPAMPAASNTIMLLLIWIYCSVSALLYGAELAASWQCALQTKPRQAVLLSRTRHVR